MRIGLFLELNKSGGGIYQYALTFAEEIAELQREGKFDDEIFVVHPASGSKLDDHLVSGLNGNGWSRITLAEPVRSTTQDASRQRWLDRVRRWIGEGIHRETWRTLRDRVQPDWRKNGDMEPIDIDRIQPQPHLAKQLRDHQVDLMLYPTPHTFSFEIGLPYIMAVHDLQHRLQPEFPEVSAEGEWERREYLFRNAARCATLLLADSEVGKEDILNCYGDCGITPERVAVLPFLPAHYLTRHLDLADAEQVLDDYGLRRPYLFYPAQFWPHKNHARIVEAIGLLKASRQQRVDVVFVGSHSGAVREDAFAHVVQLAHQHKVVEQVHYLGYVPEEQMSALYANARGLIMPTFFGPTNIPPLEAWAFGCPVITSDIRGIREQMGDAALLVNPQSVESIANGIARVWTDDVLCQELAQRGAARLASHTPSDFRGRLHAIIGEAQMRVRQLMPPAKQAQETIVK